MQTDATPSERQCTLGGSASMSGIALHTGHRVNLAVHPAPENYGIRFRRVDLPGRPEVRALVSHVVDVRRGTTIKDGEATVHTVEHILAAASALGVDNAVVDMAGPEPPIADGSAQPFLELLRAAGIVEQAAERRYFTVSSVQYLEAGETRLVVVPDPAFRISCAVKYNETMMDCQYQSLTVTTESFEKELAGARTFCLFHEIEYLMKANLIRGGSLDNAVIIKGDAIICKDALRYPDEAVRHKMLDIVGDMFLLGCRLRGHVVAIKPGHPTNVQMAKQLLAAASVPA